MQTRVTAMLGIRYPILQGGLARLAHAELAAAVSNAGGLGQISSVGLSEPAALRAEIRRARALTPHPFAVNFPLQRMDVAPLLDVVLEERVAAVAFTAGNPAPWLRRCEGHAIHSLVLTAGPEQARKAEAAGAHMVATVGHEGGGHIGRGDETTLVMVPRVVDAVKIPVLASGGIADGRGLLAALALGAEGVEMGTRFVATTEARAHAAYKAALAAARPEDTMIIKRSMGQPGRALASAHARHIVAREAAGAPLEELLDLVSGARNALGAIDGELEKAYVWAGQCVGLIDEVLPAGEVIRRMMAQAEAGMDRLAAMR